MGVVIGIWFYIIVVCKIEYLSKDLILFLKAKKAQHKAENQDDQGKQQGGEEDGVDVSAGKYGVSKMNQSQDKPNIRLIENFAILEEVFL